MFKKLACFAVLAGLSASVHAHFPPSDCPTVASIKAAGLSYAVKSGDMYTVAQIADYETNHEWLFGFTTVKAGSSHEALKVGSEWLDTLYGTPKPRPIPYENIWACVYQTGNGQYGVAITPVNRHASIQQLGTVAR